MHFFFIPLFSSGSSVHNVHSTTNVLLNLAVHINTVYMHFNSIESIQGEKKKKKKNHVLKSTLLLICGELWHWVREARLKGDDLDNASRLSRLFGSSLSEPALSVPSLLISCLRRREVLMSYFIARFEGSIPLLAISPLIFQIGLAQKEYSAGVSHVSGIL